MENVGGRGSETPDTSKLPTILEKSKDYNVTTIRNQVWFGTLIHN
jgi:hypothetical protein